MTRQPAIGVSIQAFSVPQAIEQVQQAEEQGIPTAWSTVAGFGGGDVLTGFAAALTATRSIRLGSAIIPTWPRHPLTLAQQALALHQIAPGRLRLGIGPSHEPAMTRLIGARWDRPFTHLREYLQVLRALFDTGRVEFEGYHVTARLEWREPVPVELLASALRPRSFALCGELADGAISWMCPRSYLREQALPALRRGAEGAARETPPLIAHVPVAVAGRDAAYALAREQLGRYAQVPFYRAMFEQAGFAVGGHADAGEGYSEALLDDLIVCGSEEEVAAGLRRYLDDGCGEVLAAPLLDPDDRAGSWERALRAIGRAQAAVAGA